MGKLTKLSTLVAISILVVVCLWFFKGPPELNVEFEKEKLNSIPNKVVHVETASDNINFDVFALAPSDKTAVLKYPDDSLVVIKVGDRIGSDKFLVAQITHEKVVLKDEESEDQYFVYIESAGEKGRVQKVSNRIDILESLPVGVTSFHTAVNEDD